jgi:hypothetical protein
MDTHDFVVKDEEGNQIFAGNYEEVEDWLDQRELCLNYGWYAARQNILNRNRLAVTLEIVPSGIYKV